MDTGPIIASSQLEIRDSVTSGDLLTELTLVGSELLTETLFTLEEKFSNQILQPKQSTIKQAGKITRSQARIDFSKPAQSIHNLVRAMNPEPIAWFELDNAPVRVLRTRLTESLELRIGQLSVNTGKLIVGCGAGALELIRVQPSGKNEMSGVDWFNGLRRESARIS
jgi:methionyl-tRNA formyltransferase